MKHLFFLLICLFSTWTSAQNDTPHREAFTLTLPVDSVNYYQQEVAVSPYFVKETYFKSIQENTSLLKWKLPRKE